MHKLVGGGKKKITQNNNSSKNIISTTTIHTPSQNVRVDGNKNTIFYIYDKEQSGCWIPSQCFCDPYTRTPNSDELRKRRNFVGFFVLSKKLCPTWISKCMSALHSFGRCRFCSTNKYRDRERETEQCDNKSEKSKVKICRLTCHALQNYPWN